MNIFNRSQILCFILIFNAAILNLWASPSSIFWTNCTTDVYATGTGNIEEDNYFRVTSPQSDDSSFPPDTGFELGIFTWRNFSAETGFDYLGGTDDPWFFNAKIGIAENKLFCSAPSFSIGIFNVGTRTHGPERTNENIVDLVIGRSLPDCIGGRIFIGGFSGSRAMGKNRQGFMVAYQRLFCPAKYCNDQEYFKWVFCADYASGKNTIGGGGFALGYYFTPDISILTGPVWFNSAEINGKWKWSVQIDIAFLVFNARP